MALVAVGGSSVGASSASAIVNGKPVPVADTPWIVQVVADDSFVCTGTLIRPQVVLTAAHCVLGVDPDRVVLRRQRVDGKGGSAVKVARTTFDRRFETSGRRAERYFRKLTRRQKKRFTAPAAYDIGLLELARPVTDVTPVPLAGPEHAPLIAVGSTARISGWGLTLEDDEPDRRPLSGADVPFRSAAWCAKRLRSPLGPSPDALCVGQLRPPITGGCYGDSGGPLFAQTPTGPVQLAVASQVLKPLCDKTQTVYQSVLSGTSREYLDRELTPGGTLLHGKPTED